MSLVLTFVLRAFGSVVLVTTAYFVVLYQEIPLLFVVSDSVFTILHILPALGIALAASLLWPRQLRRAGPVLLGIAVFALLLQQHLASAANTGLTQKVSDQFFFRGGAVTPVGAAVASSTATAYAFLLALTLARLLDGLLDRPGPSGPP